MLIVGGLQPTEDIYGSVERGVKKKNIVTSLPYVNVAITIIIRIGTRAESLHWKKTHML